MKARSLLCLALALVPGCSGSFPTPADSAAMPLQGASLDDLFDLDRFGDSSTLDLKVGAPQREGALIVTPLEFTSFSWERETWRHRAVWYRLAEVDASTAGPNALTAVVDRERLARAAAAEGVPALWIRDGFPGTRYGIDGEPALMQFSMKRYLKTGDGRWVGFLWLARVFVRGVTTVGELPGGSDRVVVSGCSKRGVASWVASAVDERVVGAMPTCWNGAGGEAWLRLKGERWGDAYEAGATGPGFVNVQKQIRMIRGPQGRRLLGWTDPTEFADRLDGKSFVIAVGTNDPLYPAMSDSIYLAKLPADSRMALIPNEVHRVTETHEAAWRTLLIRLKDPGELDALPQISLSFDEKTRRVRGELETTRRWRQAVWTLWHAEDPSGAYLDVTWKGIPMVVSETDDGAVAAELPRTDAAYRGWFVAVRDDERSAYLTSPFQELRRDGAGSSENGS